MSLRCIDTKVTFRGATFRSVKGNIKKREIKDCNQSFYETLLIKINFSVVAANRTDMGFSWFEYLNHYNFHIGTIIIISISRT